MRGRSLQESMIGGGHSRCPRWGDVTPGVHDEGKVTPGVHDEGGGHFRSPRSGRQVHGEGGSLQGSTVRGRSLQESMMRGRSLQESTMRGRSLQESTMRGRSLQESTTFVF